ncbi:hypothetical protein BJF78_02360 [Pseudonocardia sp. CNS-139]|nr:hypothetical protein BJF78_02360 [Pseudonocardia sp. CNS-139]
MRRYSSSTSTFQPGSRVVQRGPSTALSASWSGRYRSGWATRYSVTASPSRCARHWSRSSSSTPELW